MENAGAEVDAATPLVARAQLPNLTRAYSSKTEVRSQASQAQAQIQPEADDAIPSYVNPDRWEETEARGEGEGKIKVWFKVLKSIGLLVLFARVNANL